MLVVAADDWRLECAISGYWLARVLDANNIAGLDCDDDGVIFGLVFCLRRIAAVLSLALRRWQKMKVGPETHHSSVQSRRQAGWKHERRVGASE